MAKYQRKSNPKNKGGAPKKQVSQGEFEKLCGLQCTKKEFCAWFHIDDKTLERWCKETYQKGFSEVFSEKRNIGKISLRRTQFQLAETSVAMAIWLGKQLLGQKDTSRTELTGKDGMAIRTDRIKFDFSNKSIAEMKEIQKVLRILKAAEKDVTNSTENEI